MDNEWNNEDSNYGVYAKGVTSYIIITKSTTKSNKISKGTLKISAPKVTKTYKKAGKFKVTVKSKASGKAVKGIKVILKVDGKTFTKKTNKNGVVSISTKSLSKGKHKVVITAKGNSKFKKATKKSSITIKAKSKTSNGKIKTYIVVKDLSVKDFTIFGFPSPKSYINFKFNAYLE